MLPYVLLGSLFVLAAVADLIEQEQENVTADTLLHLYEVKEATVLEITYASGGPLRLLNVWFALERLEKMGLIRHRDQPHARMFRLTTSGARMMGKVHRLQGESNQEKLSCHA
jgi:predicted transcriptional regulator